MKTNIVLVITYRDIISPKILLKINFFLKYLYAVEVRVDTFPGDKLKKITSLLQKVKSLGLRTILTFRSFKEGGFGGGISDKKRFLIIKSLIKENFRFIDFIDIEFFSEIKNKVINLAKKYNKKVILSFHQLENKKFDSSILTKNIKKIVCFGKRNCCLVKIVCFIPEFEEYFYLLRKIYFLDKEFKTVTFFTTSSTALISRVVSFLLKMPLVYTTISRPVVKTQPSLKDFIDVIKKIYKF